LEPPGHLALPAASAGASKALDVSHSCQVASILRNYVICSVENGSYRLDKSVIIVPEESTSWIDAVKKFGADYRSRVSETSRNTESVGASTCPTFGGNKFPLPNEEFDFALWCLILQELESWKPQAKKRENPVLDVGSPGSVSEKSEAWQLFDHKMSDPSSLIVKKVIRARSSTGYYDQSATAEDSYFDVNKTLDSPPVQTVKPKNDGSAFNLRCLPVFLRAIYTWQNRVQSSQNIVLKGSGYRILIKAARSIKERCDSASNPSDKMAALKYRNETLPVLLRLLPHLLHQVQDEHWASFSMTLELAWWLAELAPVHLNMLGLHLLSCACVLGCRFVAYLYFYRAPRASFELKSAFFSDLSTNCLSRKVSSTPNPSAGQATSLR
jgi:hypothetical protein